MPGGLRLAIDSKANLDEFIKATEEKQIDKQEEYIKQFISKLKSRVKALSSKEYQKYLDKSIPYVIMFIPGEAAVRAALQHDTDLYKEAQKMKVMLASPVTIMPLILLIAHAWKQHKAGENAIKLSEEVIDLGTRLKSFFNHFSDIGSNLSRATNKFNSAVGSFDMKVYPKIEQINNLGGNIQLDSTPVKILEEPRISKRSKGSLTLDKPSVE
jgi:DNA recombination protein RmuC